MLEALGELQADLSGAWRPCPEQRARRGHFTGRHAVGKGRRLGRRAAGECKDGGAGNRGYDELHAATLTKGAFAVDIDGVRRFLVTVAALAVLAVPAGAQPASSWVRHQGDGFSVDLPASWADEKDRARMLREVRRIAGDDPDSPGSSTTCWRPEAGTSP